MRQANTKLFRVRHTDVSGLVGVRKNVVTAFHASKPPARRIQMFNKLLAVHSG